ncbi:MAG: hypothetical protein HY736_11820 [Verrucomicrobia bacterium]|nr:hypothetical protein [Verrucomicrobiota bacterium]
MLARLGRVERSASTAAVDAANPWLGLASFTEETRSFFHGRDEEVAELSRRVQRKLLTVLFGQSGHGKTSLLRAGLVPRLRPEGFCPVYVRLDYAPSSPPPTEQIKQAVFRGTAEAGTWTKVGASVPGESLWEFLHHRDDVLKNAAGRTLTPLLIFDQFEEIFTLAQTDATGRARAQAFLTDLADLVENRPPAALEARIESDEADAARFDFTRADYRILVTLREDYLAHLEGLKNLMPSVTQNRVRLARMTGAEALDAVLKPGAGLVTEDVARSIVLFVSGATDLAHAEVEPSLLSLVCRELNETRRARDHATISADLLAGSRDTILSEFYERTLADEPPGVRRFIEDELLTDSGYRESIAEERVKKGFAAAGAPPPALGTLVDRRLLRVEERLDVRRVELTHDVLCSVAMASRSLRHEREAKEAAVRLLEETRAKAEASRRALLRARFFTAVCAALALVAVISAIYGYIGQRRAQETRRLAESSRGEAEKLVGFLLADFYDELAPTGRLEIVGRLAQQAVAYYDGLPAALRTPETERNRAMALVRQAGVLGLQGDNAQAESILKGAIADFEKLRAGGDTSEEATIGLSLALGYRGRIGVNVGRPEAGVADLSRAVTLLRPVATAPGSSRRARQEFANLLNTWSHQQAKEDGIASCEEARGILAGLGALDLSDLAAASAYGDISDSEARHALAIGRLDDAERLELETDALAEKILIKRPGDLRAMLDRAWSPNVIGLVEARRFHPAAALDWAGKFERAADHYVRFDPSHAEGWRMRIGSRQQSAQALLAQGRAAEAAEKYRAVIALGREAPGGAAVLGTVPSCWFELAMLAAQRGERAAAEQALAEATRTQDAIDRELKTEEFGRLLGREFIEQFARSVRLALQEFSDVEQNARGALARIDQLTKRPEVTVALKEINDFLRRAALIDSAQAALRLGHVSDAEKSARAAAVGPQGNGTFANLAANRAFAQSLLALTLARRNRGGEALAIIEPAVAVYRDLQKQNADGVDFRHDFAFALYAQAMACGDDADGRAQRRAALDEAAKLLEGLTDEAKQLHDQRELIGWIAAERAK